MLDTHSIHWDPAHPVLHVTHGPGLWSDDDFDVYEKDLASALAHAPTGGFDMLLDQTEAIPQRPEIAARRERTLDALLAAGLRRTVIIVPSAVLGLQNTRIRRDAGLSADMVECRSREHALALLAL
jgi:hypothetical protein